MIECAFFGALGRDAELKTSAKGKRYLRLAVRTGENDAVQWVAVTSFDDDAIAAVDKLVKGARVYVEGRLSLDQWTANDGTVRHGLSVMSFHTRLSAIGRNKPPRRKSADNASPAAQSWAAPPHLNDEVPEW